MSEILREEKNCYFVRICACVLKCVHVFLHGSLAVGKRKVITWSLRQRWMNKTSDLRFYAETGERVTPN